VAAPALLLLSGFAAGPASASTTGLESCPKPPPAQKFDGDGTLPISAATKRDLRQSGLRPTLISPANAFTGRPTFPLRKASLSGKVSVVSLRGGFRLAPRKAGPRVRISSLKLVIRSGTVPVVNAVVGGSRIRLFNVRGASRKLDLKDGVLNFRSGSARLTRGSAARLSDLLGLRRVNRLSTGRNWGRLSVFAARNNKVKDPVAETPVEPPFLERPIAAADITSATIRWRVRESFIRYVAVGAGTSVAEGATADPPEEIGGAGPLIYGFSFPFTDGWVAPGSEPAAIHGGGKVGFRHCRNTINFTVADPEIELNGDADSRLIFKVDGTDGTAFPNSRAVMVQLIPSLATKTTDGNTTTLSGIPGYIPQAATGIFADFYPPFFPGSVDAPGAEFSHFGSVTVTYTTG